MVVKHVLVHFSILFLSYLSKVRDLLLSLFLFGRIIGFLSMIVSKALILMCVVLDLALGLLAFGSIIGFGLTILVFLSCRLKILSSLSG